MEIYLNLILIGLIPVAQTIIFSFLKEKGVFNKVGKKVETLIISLAFGLASILGTVLGVDVGGAIANARDAAPLCAGLIFSGPAGIIAGIIGGTYRFFATYWGSGAYSQVACSVSTILAGLFAAFLRRYIFDNRRPSMLFGFVTALVVEVLHMSILFLTHLDNVEQAYVIVKICTIPMIICNSASVVLAILATDFITKKKWQGFKHTRKITERVQLWLLIVVAVSYFITTSFVYGVQTSTAKRNAEQTLNYSIYEIEKDIPTYGGDIVSIASNRHVGIDGYVLVCNESGIILSDTNNHGGKFIYENVNYIGIDSLNKNDCDKLFTRNVLNKKSIYKYRYSNGYYIIACMTEEEMFIDRENSLYINSYMEVLAYAILFIIVYQLIYYLVVIKIKTINDNLGKISEGDLEISLNEKSSVELESLSNYINTTVASLKNYIDEADKRIDAELAFAKTIQHSALPSIFPAYPEIDDFDIYALMETAKEVGGDFYDFYTFGNNKLAVLIADVSGKGIPSAMFMMRAKALIRSLTETGQNIDEVLYNVNNSLCLGNDAGMFVTCFLGIFDYKSGLFQYVNAGHNPPMIYRNGGTFEKLIGKHGFVLAGMENMKYKVNEITLNKGDKLLLYTDGVTEAINSDNELYGESRLIDYLNSHQNCSARSIVEGVKEDVDNFSKQDEQFDDITMLILTYGDNFEYMEFSSKEESFEKANEFVLNCVKTKEISKKIVNQIAMAFEELYINVCHYAYKKEGIIKVGCGYNGNTFVMKIVDNGERFNPLNKDDPNIELDADSRSIGGLGIFMAKKTMDNIMYSYENNSNVLIIEKKV